VDLTNTQPLSNTTGPTPSVIKDIKTLIPKKSSNKNHKARSSVSFDPDNLDYIRTNVMNIMRDYKQFKLNVSSFNSDYPVLCRSPSPPVIFQPQAPDWFKFGLSTKVQESVDDLTESMVKLQQNGVKFQHNVSLHDDLQAQIATLTKTLQELGAGSISTRHSVEVGVDPKLRENLINATNNLSTLNTDGIKLNVGLDSAFNDWYSSPESFMGKVKQILTEVGKTVSDDAVLIICITLFLFVKPQNSGQKVSLYMFIVALMSSRHLLYDIFVNLPIYKWLQKPGVEPQAPGIDEISSMLVSLIGAFYATKLGSDLIDAKVLVTSLSTLSRIIPSIKSFTTAISVTSCAFYSMFKSALSGSPFFLRYGISEVDDLIQAAKTLISKSDRDLLSSCQEVYDEVDSISQSLFDRACTLPMGGQFSGAKTAMMTLRLSLENIKKKIMATGFSYSGLRPESVGIMMRGPPGVGKSMLLNHLCAALAAKTFDQPDYEAYKKAPKDYVYNRQVETCFWDGYTSKHRFVIFDDILQLRQGVVTGDSEAMNIIRAINMLVYQLHMASIEQKGNTYYRAAFTLATTNRKTFQIEDLYEIGAFLRRWDVVLDVSVKQEFAVGNEPDPWKRKLDPDLLPLKEGITHFGPDHVQFQLMKLERAEPIDNAFVPIGPLMSFDEVVEVCAQGFLTKVGRFASYRSDLDYTLYRFRPTPDHAEHVKPQSNTKSPYVEFYQPDVSANSEGETVQQKVANILGSSVVEFCAFYDIKAHLIQILKRPHWHIPRLEFEILRYTTWLQRDYEVQFMELRVFVHAFIMKICAHEHILASAMWEDPYQDMIEFGFFEHPGFREFLSPLKKPLQRCSDVIDGAKGALEETKTRFSKTCYDTFKVFEAFFFTSYDDDAKEIYSFFDNPKFKTHRRLAKYAAVSAASVATYLALKNVFHWVLGAYEHFFAKPFGPESDSRETARASIRRTVKPIRPPVRQQAAMSTNINLNKICDNVLGKSVLTIFVPPMPYDKALVENKTKLGFCLAVRSRTLLMPYHFLSIVSSLYQDGHYKASDLVHFEHPNASRSVVVSVLQLLEGFSEDASLEPRDLAVVVLPEKVQPFPDIVKHFIPQSAYSRLVAVKTMLAVPGSTPGYHYLDSRRRPHIVVEAPQYEKYTVEDVFTYTTKTQGGDCGSILFLIDTRQTSSIIGLHVAGDNGMGRGVAASISREELEGLLENAPDVYIEEPLEIPLNDECVLEMENMEAVGYVCQGSYPNMAGVSKIKRSPFYGRLSEIKKAPARLRPFYSKTLEREIDPMEEALAGFGVPDFYVDKDDLENVSVSLLDSLQHRSGISVEKSVYNFEMAVLGDPDDPDFKSIPRDTSAGYPYNCESGVKSKKIFFGDAPEYVLDTPECIKLREIVNKIVQDAQKGIRKTHIFTDCLKDEKRSLEKVECGKTRMFSASPTPLLIASRMYFGAFQKWLIKNRIDNGCTIGINPFGRDWGYMLRRMLSTSQNAHNFGAGDFKAFDKRQVPQIMWEVLQIINDWYGDSLENQRVRKILFYELVNSKHINRNRLCIWWSGMPSGHPLTSFVNCLYNQFLFRLCFIKLLPELTPWDFDSYVNLQVHGDDNIYSVHSAISHLFNETNVASAMLDFGMTYTPEDKSLTAHSEGLRHFEEISFLKRKFRKSVLDGSYVAPLELDTVLDELNWRSSNASWIGDFELLIDNVFRELSLHDRDTFNYWTKKILELVVEEGFTHPPSISQTGCLRRIKAADN
jgi:hypothetical protein